MFAVNLKRLMIKNQVKVTQLANATNCGQSTLYQYLDGKLNPSLERKQVFADYFGVTTEELERDEDMDKELMKNGSGYVDTTAGKALTNVQKKEIDPCYRGEIFEYQLANGQWKQALIVSADERSHDMQLSVIMLDEAEKGGWSVPIICGTKMYANCTSLSYGIRTRLGNFVKRVTDEEMREVDSMIISALGLNSPYGYEDLGTVLDLKKQLANAHETIERQMIEVNKATAERDEAKSDAQYFQHYAETYKEQIAELNAVIDSLQETIRETKENNADKYLVKIEAERDLYKAMYEQMLERLIAR